MAQEIDEEFRKIRAVKGVLGTLIINYEGIAVKSTFDEKETVHYATAIRGLVDKIRLIIQTLDKKDDLIFLRLRTNTCEIVISPHENFILLAVQEYVD